MKSKKSSILLLILIFIAISLKESQALGVVAFGPKETKIVGSIPYSVLGRYTAHFTAFKGRIILDDNSAKVRSVYLEIDANSIKSNTPWCDKFARSRRLLNAARYPKIIFKSGRILEDAKGYEVEGVLQMHGIKREMLFPFKAGVMIDPKTGRKILDLKGNWLINRKGFNIIWNKYFDKGGVVVGDNFTVSWGIRAYLPG